MSTPLSDTLPTLRAPHHYNRPVNARLIYPALYAAITFLLVRVINDIPIGSNYLNHSLWFIAIELLCTLFASYLCFYITAWWVTVVERHSVPTLLEYSCPALFAAFVAASITALSHWLEGSPLGFTILYPPILIGAMTEIWIYLWLKYSMMQRKYHDEQLRSERIRNKQLLTELRLLQSQFHPHFLFNMLNTIYFTIDETNEEARADVEHLSNLLRRQLYPTDGEVPLSSEVSVLHSYIHLSSKRMAERAGITVDIPSAESPAVNTGQLIYPHLLLPLVENVFKHAGGDYSISISLTVSGGWLQLTTSNSVSASRPSTPSSPHGIGLSNLSQRLALIYPPSHFTLHTGLSDGNTYQSVLRIRLA